MPEDSYVTYIYDESDRGCVELVWQSNGGKVVLSDFSEIVWDTAARPIWAPSSEEMRYWESPRSETELLVDG